MLWIKSRIHVKIDSCYKSGHILLLSTAVLLRKQNGNEFRNFEDGLTMLTVLGLRVVYVDTNLYVNCIEICSAANGMIE